MTIPSRPAPPPPQPSTWANGSSFNNSPTLSSSSVTLQSPQSRHSKTSSTVSSNLFTTHSTNRYGAVTHSTRNSRALPGKTEMIIRNKKIPPPRPPPPRINQNLGIGDTVLKKRGPPQSVNVLSNIFGKKRAPVIKKQPPPKIPLQSIAVLKNQPFNSQQHQDGDVQLISFDSPPSSPTLTQKSNSDCLSIDSFSSDSNFSSPNNGSTSQPESGFEDDFTNPPDPWEAISNDPFSDNSKPIISDLKITQPVRNLHAVNKIQTDNILCNGKSLLPPVQALTMPTIIKPKDLQNPRNSSPIYSVFGRTTISTDLKKCVFENTDDLDNSLPSPPMPNCPPPPPPSNRNDVLGVVTGRLDALELYDDTKIEGPSYGIALYDFEGVENEDLTLRENEKIYLLQRLNEEWYLGRNRRGCEGIFPANYIEVKVPLKDETLHNAAIVTNSHNSNKVRVIYKFIPEIPEDLPLNVDDIVTVLYRINDDWLYGETGNQKGQFPANFIEYIPENLSQIKGT